MSEIQKIQELLIISIQSNFDEVFLPIGFHKFENFSKDSFTIEYKRQNRIIKFYVSLFPTDYPYYLSTILIKKKLLQNYELPLWFIIKNKSVQNRNFSLIENSNYLNKIQIEELVNTIKDELLNLCNNFINGFYKEFDEIYKLFKVYNIELQKK